METLFITLLNMSVTASWLILAVTGLRLLFKRAPKWLVSLLWAGVGIRLVFPFSFKSALSLIPSVQTVAPDILYAVKPEIHSGILVFNSMINPVVGESLSPLPGASVNPLQIWTRAAALIWLSGMFLLFLYAALSYLRLKRKVRASVPLEGNVRICDEIDTPFILGFLKPRIYLPSGMEKEGQDLVLAHERAHLKRRDHLWKPLGFSLLAVYWFNPLTWLAYLLLCRDIELACDEKVIRTMEREERIIYSELLLSFSIPHRSVMVCPLAFGEVGLKERIRTVLNYKRPAFWVILLAVILSIILAVCFLTNPKDPLPSTPSDTDGVSIPSGETDPRDPISSAEKWLDYYSSDNLDWEKQLETSIPEFPEVTFRWTPGEVQAITNGETETLFLGMPIWNTFFCDLNGDGKPELCSTVSFGSGIVDTHVLVYDYANRQIYSLWNRMICDYSLYMEGDLLFAAKRPYREEEILERGQLILLDGRLAMEGDSDPPPLYEPITSSEVDYQASAFQVGCSEAGYQAMVERARNRGNEGRFGYLNYLIPLVMLGSRTDFDAFYKDMSAFCDFDMDDPDTGSFSRQARVYTEDYFQDHSLFIAYLFAGNNADRFEVQDALIEGEELRFAIRHLQAAAGDAVMTGWFLAVEVRKADIQDCSLYDAYIAESVQTGPESEWFGEGVHLLHSYRYQGGEPIDVASFSLLDNGDFRLSMSPLVSFQLRGQYAIDGEFLVLRTWDDEYTYVFKQASDDWIFDADRSSPLFTSLSSVTDGSLFRLQD